MGKTALVHQALNLINEEKKYRGFYVNLNNTLNEEDFLIRLAEKTLGLREGDQLKLMRELANWFTHLRPFIRHDTFLASPSISFHLERGYQAETTLEQFFNFLEKSDSRIVIALDDFQQVLSYRDGALEPLLRSFASKCANVSLIFCFEKCLHTSRLLNPGQDQGDFYSSLPRVPVESIPNEVFVEYISRQFSGDRRKLSSDLPDHILEWCRYRTGYVQFVCNRLFQTGVRQPDDWFLERLFQQVLDEWEGVFYNYRTLLASNQWILLRGIARERGARQVMGTEFIRKNNLGTPSSVQTALLALQEKRLVYDEDGRWYVADVFLSRWLER